MQKCFPAAWIPIPDLSVDESLQAFKECTYLKIFIEDKLTKYGFLDYTFCTLVGYFFLVSNPSSSRKSKAKEA